MRGISESVKTAFFVVLITFVLLYVFTKVLGPIPFAVNSITTTKTDMFTVSGEGEVSAIPETAHIQAGVTKTALTVVDAKNQVNSITNAILAELKTMGIEEKSIKTTNFSIYPNYSDTPLPQQEPVVESRLMAEPVILPKPIDTNNSKGYVVSQNIEIKVTPIEKANQVVDLLTNRGANVLGGIQFVLADEVREKLEQKAREEAIKKAKTKANTIAHSAGIRLGRIINVQESGFGFNPSYMRADDLSQKEVDQYTNLQAGENTVRMTVTLFYETL